MENLLFQEPPFRLINFIEYYVEQFSFEKLLLKRKLFMFFIY